MAGKKNESLWHRMKAAFESDPMMGRKRLAKLAGVSPASAQRFLQKISQPENIVDAQHKSIENLSDLEREYIIKSLNVQPQKPPVKIKWNNDSFKFAAIGDSHIGHQKAHKEWWDIMCDKIDREQVSLCLHTGDITEGMSGREGHVYELEAIGATAQVELAAHRISQIPCEVKGITGNHDLWGFKRLGHDPGVELENRCRNFEYLGQNEAVVSIDGIDIMMSHPGDGSAYAVSYALQQFINALSGGEKPHILLMGHHHKSVFFQYRNIQAFETGTLCGQTGWMRGKKLQAMAGFWIVEVWPNQDGIERIRSEWIPFYS